MSMHVGGCGLDRCCNHQHRFVAYNHSIVTESLNAEIVSTNVSNIPLHPWLFAMKM